ncbi:hypothetical protein JXD20_02745 [Candidatus Peregrinibacteria bacterium]|nr:hypothetical protein [Candidatus Peregrinibacteria bacterium]
MLDDNLNGEKLSKMIKNARFNHAEDFMNELEEPLQKNFFVDDDRIVEKLHTQVKRADIRIMDKVTKREVLMVIGFKILRDAPQLDPLDIQNFHAECKKLKSRYGVLMTETEVHFYEYKKEGPEEIKEIQPFNYIDADFEMHMGSQQYQDWLISKKYWIIGFGLLIIMLLSMSLANQKQCEQSGPIKAEIRSTGEKMYFLPETPGYSGRTTGDVPGERRYCDEQDAIDDGFVLAK